MNSPVNEKDFEKFRLAQSQFGFSKATMPEQVEEWCHSYAQLVNLPLELVLEMNRCQTYEEYVKRNFKLVSVSELKELTERVDGLAKAVQFIAAGLLQEGLIREVKENGSVESDIKKERHPNKSRYNKRWTGEEDAYLIEHQHQMPQTLRKVLHRTPHAISQRRSYLRSLGKIE